MNSIRHSSAVGVGVLAVLFSLPAFTIGERDADTDLDIIVTAQSGDVDVTIAGVRRDVRIGGQLDLPVRVATRENGSFGFRQSQTGVTMAPDSEIEIPESAREGQLIARMFQHRGNVFYDVEKRTAEKLQVETPYLVAVVKGTRFNVAVTANGTAISLFEGLLEIRTPDGQQVVALEAGEIAIRNLTDGAIRILPMNPDLFDPLARVDAAIPGADGNTTNGLQAELPGVAGTIDGAGIRPAATLAVNANLPVVGNDDLRQETGFGAALSLATQIDGPGGPVGFESAAVLGLDAGLDTAVDLGSGTADIGLDTGVDVGIDLGGAGVATAITGGLGATVDLGSGTADIGLDTGLDSAIDLGGASIDTAVDVGLGSTVDLGGGTADIGLDTGVGAGIGLGGTGVDTTLDLGLGAGVDLGGSAPLVDLDVDLAVELDADLGLDVPVVDPALDLVGGALDTTVDTLDTTVDTTVDTVLDTAGGAVGGLLGPLF